MTSGEARQTMTRHPSDVIAGSPMKRLQFAAIGVCILLNMFDGYDVLVMAFSATAITEDWGLSAGELGILLSAALAGMAVGSIGVSQVADIIGRRPTVIACNIVIAAGMALSMMAPGYEALLILRFITGLAIGTMQACLNVIVAEFSSNRARPTAISLYTMGQPLGGVLGGLVVAALIAAWSWRAAFGFGAMTSLIAIPLVLLFLPESLDHLTTRRPRGALSRINHTLRRIGHSPLPALPDRPEGATLTARARWHDVLTGTMGIKTLLLGLSFFVLMGAFYFANSWTPRLITLGGHSASDGTTAGILFSAGGIVGALAFGLLATWLSQWRAGVVVFVLAAGSFGVYAFFLEWLSLALLSAAFLGLTTSAGIAAMFTLGAASYTTEVRATGVGLIIGCGRVGAIVSPIAVGFLGDVGWPPQDLYVLFVLPVLLGAITLAMASRVQPNKDRSLTPAP